MTGIKLKNSILKLAIEGKLVSQDDNDTPASELLKEIKKEKESLIKEGKIKADKTISEIYRKDGSFFEKIIDTKTGKEIETCIDEEIPFDIPASWEWVRLSNIGNYKKGPFGSSLTKSIFVPKGDNTIKVYEQQNAIKKDYTLGEYYITEEYYNSKMKGFSVEAGDILVSCAGTIGETYVLPNDIEKGIINQALMRMRITSHIYIEYFLIYFDYMLKSNSQKNSKGSAIKNIPPFDVFKNLLFLLPPLEEQKRIVAKIESIIPHINIYNDKQKELETLDATFKPQMKKAILKYAIEGKLVSQDSKDIPASELLKEIKKEKESLIKEGKIKADKTISEIYRKDGSFFEKIIDTKTGKEIETCIDEELPFDIPASWEWVRLYHISKIVGGATPNSGNTSYYATPGSGIAWITPADMKYIENKYISRGKRDITEEGYKSCSTFIIPKNSIIFSSRAPIGYIAISKNELCTNQGFKSIVPYINNIELILYYFIMFRSKSIEAKASGTTFKEISGSALEKELIPIPPLEEQKRIVAKIEKIINIIK